MSVTIIFVFSDECGACTYFKESVYEQVKALFGRLGAKTVEFKAPTLRGYSAQDAPHAFLTQVSMFPTILCVKTDILRKYSEGQLKDDIFKYLYVWNGAIAPAGQANNVKRIVGLTPQIYNLSMQDFERFYNDFLASPAYTNNATVTETHSRGELPTKMKLEKKEQETGIRNVANKMCSCNGVRAVPIRKK